MTEPMSLREIRRTNWARLDAQLGARLVDGIRRIGEEDRMADAEDNPKYGHCPSCGQLVQASPGENCPPHTDASTKKLCPGGTAF